MSLRKVAVVTLLWMLSRAFPGCAAPAVANSNGTVLPYEEPKHLIGTILEMSPDPKKVLFKSERTSTHSGSGVQVLCEYTYPDGSSAAHEKMVYEAGKLASYELKELQNGERGSVLVRPDPKNPAKQRLLFEYITGQGAETKKKLNSEALDKETLVDDMIPAFITSQWGALMSGSAAKFRYIALSRAETVGFKLVKESETTWKGVQVVRIKMEPTSMIIAQLVDPLFFVVEKNEPHRVLEYIGRTTPLIKKGNKWADLDAVTDFDYR